MDSAPAIVLVRPQLGVNIGATARAMANFGLSDLRLVAPRDGWPNPEAQTMSAGALSDRVRANVYGDIDAAIADRQCVLAATARRRRMEIDLTDPETAIGSLIMESQASAVLFGPENSGLTSNDMARCVGAIRIPATEDFASLNLAHAVCVIAYAWRLQCSDQKENRNIPALATMDEQAAMCDQMVAALEVRGYFFPPDRVPSMRRALIGSFARTRWTSGDIQRFRGVIAALTRKE